MPPSFGSRGYSSDGLDHEVQPIAGAEGCRAFSFNAWNEWAEEFTSRRHQTGDCNTRETERSYLEEMT